MDRRRFQEREQAWQKFREWDERAPRPEVDLRSRLEWFESARRLATGRWQPDIDRLAEKVRMIEAVRAGLARLHRDGRA